ncbi:MAG TPA: hypothetical protein VHE30_18750 [Polyangiaceae bacterium]|nr:hypothetical protein [Polyangiaceae bacterium]
MAELKPNSDSRLALRDAPNEPWRDAEWQQLWLILRARPWTSLALIPAAPGAPPDFTLTIAVTLARIGMLHLGTQIHVADATRISLVHLEQVTQEVRRLTQDGELVLVALPTIEENPMSVSLARSTNGAVLCVLTGEMQTSQAKRTVEKVGANQFVGSIVLHPSASSPHGMQGARAG